MTERISPWRAFVKGICLFLIMEFAFAAGQPNLGAWSVYNAGMKRLRFPISTHAPEDAALEVGNLDAMFASHIISQPKEADEFRVLILGDSAVWGILESAQDTVPGQLDSLGLSTCAGQKARFYNLSFPRSSTTKDLMILDKAMQYQPDMVIWVVTLYTVMPKTRVDHWLITQNPSELYRLNDRFHFLPKNYEPETLTGQILSQQRALFRVLRYQLFSLIPMATGLDQLPPAEYGDIPDELNDDLRFEGLHPPTLRPEQLSLDQIQDALEIAKGLPVLLVNEPIKIVEGVPNSDIRYNAYYPRWVYDQYREILGRTASQNGWNYMDLWNMFPPDYFTNTPLHLNPEGERRMAEHLATTILELACAKGNEP